MKQDIKFSYDKSKRSGTMSVDGKKKSINAKISGNTIPVTTGFSSLPVVLTSGSFTSGSGSGGCFFGYGLHLI